MELDFTLLNVLSICGLAIAGSVLLVSARRIMLVIKHTERIISRTVDEKNMLANELRLLRREETQIKQAIEEADAAVTQMTRQNEQIEQRVAFLKEQPRRILTMIDGTWRRFDRLFEVRVTNPSMPNALPKAVGGGSWGEGRLLHGFARATEELRARVEARYNPSAGFMIGEIEMLNLNSEGPPPAASKT